MKKNSISNYKKRTKNDFSDKITALLYEHSGKAYSVKQLIKKLSLKNTEAKQKLAEALEKLEKSGRIMRLKNDHFKANKKTETITGRVDHVSPRYAFIVSAEKETDVMVPTERLRGAMDGDLVRVSVYGRAEDGKRQEGEVEEILEYKREEVVGRIEISQRFAFVIPDSRKLYNDIFIPEDHIKGAKNKDKVIVRITERRQGDKNPVGKVIDILGKAGDNDAEMHSIMAEFGLPVKFSQKILKDAEKISEKIDSAEIQKRRDFRGIDTFTIDPADAKDFDDALSIRKVKDGLWEIGVHIADVTHYVRPGTELEEEAFNRATSVYLVDRTIPMLPEKLSNNLCSLRPNEDKLTFSAVFEMNENAEVKKRWFGRTVIHSKRRFAYEEAQEILEKGSGDFAEQLTTLNRLAKTLKEERFAKGAIAFETVEVKFKLDPKGKPLGIYMKERKDAHKLIEEFMLLANKEVAEFVRGKGKGKTSPTMVYRIHERPDPDKLKNFAAFAQRFGYKINTEEQALPKSLNDMAEKVEGKPEQNILQSLAVRTMAKARYSTETEWHYGLAFKNYTHFTSPIRRYPDMMVHRLLQHYLDGGKSVDKNEYEEYCIHSSDMEKRAAEAERASIKYKQVEFMSLAEDKVYDGIVSGVTDWGIYVEITETRCEGMIRMTDMKDDFYELDADNYRVIGRRTKRIITFGDPMQVRIKATDLDRRTMDLEPI